jgi:hypothetical protein
VTVTATQHPKASQDQPTSPASMTFAQRGFLFRDHLPSRDQRKRDARRFREAWRQAREAGPLTEAELEAYYASDEYRREQEYHASDECKRDWHLHVCARRLARNPAPMTTPEIGIPAPRARERRDTATARQAVAAGDDPEPGEPPPAAAPAGVPTLEGGGT